MRWYLIKEVIHIRLETDNRYCMLIAKFSVPFSKPDCKKLSLPWPQTYPTSVDPLSLKMFSNLIRISEHPLQPINVILLPLLTMSVMSGFWELCKMIFWTIISREQSTLFSETWQLSPSLEMLLCARTRLLWILVFVREIPSVDSSSALSSSPSFVLLRVMLFTVWHMQMTFVFSYPKSMKSALLSSSFSTVKPLLVCP